MARNLIHRSISPLHAWLDHSIACHQAWTKLRVLWVSHSPAFITHWNPQALPSFMLVIRCPDHMLCQAHWRLWRRTQKFAMSFDPGSRHIRSKWTRSLSTRLLDNCLRRNLGWCSPSTHFIRVYCLDWMCLYSVEHNFTTHPDSVQLSKVKLVRYQQNPTKYWGPGTKADNGKRKRNAADDWCIYFDKTIFSVSTGINEAIHVLSPLIQSCSLLYVMHVMRVVQRWDILTSFKLHEGKLRCCHSTFFKPESYPIFHGLKNSSFFRGVLL